MWKSEPLYLPCSIDNAPELRHSRRHPDDWLQAAVHKYDVLLCRAVWVSCIMHCYWCKMSLIGSFTIVSAPGVRPEEDRSSQAQLLCTHAARQLLCCWDCQVRRGLGLCSPVLALSQHSGLLT